MIGREKSMRSEMTTGSATFIAKSWATNPCYIDPGKIFDRMWFNKPYAEYLSVVQAGIEALRQRTKVKIPCHILVCSPSTMSGDCFELALSAAKRPGETTLQSVANPSRIHPLAEKKE
jgi:hypothetical protein